MDRQLTLEDRMREHAKTYVCLNTIVEKGNEVYTYKDETLLKFIKTITIVDVMKFG